MKQDWDMLTVYTHTDDQKWNYVIVIFTCIVTAAQGVQNQKLLAKEEAIFAKKAANYIEGRMFEEGRSDGIKLLDLR